MVSKKMMPNFNMFYSRILNWIFRKINGTYVVTFDKKFSLLIISCNYTTKNDYQ